MSSTLLSDAQSLYVSGDHTAAAAAYTTALAAGEDPCACYLGLGVIDLARDQPDAAITHLKTAAAADPNNVDVLTALGIAFSKAGQVAKATTVLAETVRRAPHMLEPRLSLARAFAVLKRFADARHVMADTVAAFPDDAEAWRLKGSIERQADQLEDALKSLEQAATLSPDNAAIANDLGVVCRALGRYQDAETHYRTAIRRDPNSAVARANLGNLLERLGRMEEAETCLRTAFDLDPAAPDAAYNLAALLTKLERPDEALPLLNGMVKASPDRWDAWTNLGIARMDTGDLKGAEAALRHAITLKPGNPEAHYSLAWLLLLTGRHAEGWQELEWRWHLPVFSSETRSFDAPAWTGDPLGSRTLLVHAEQGFGDTLQFVRFLADIPKESGQVILECQAPLARLLQDLPGASAVVTPEDKPPDFQVHAPLLSLPRLLGYGGARTNHAAGYLGAPHPPSAALTVPDNGRKRIGLVWAGAPENKIDRRRHMDIELFLPIFDATDADFVSLQIGQRSTDLEHLPTGRFTYDSRDRVQDFHDTAAVMGQLDLVIGVDTAVIHLAGALGVPAWVLLPFMPDYRWGLGASETAWYDSMRLFRQPEHGDWTSPIATICTALRTW